MPYVHNRMYILPYGVAKYKAKAAIDTFCQRIGDVAQAGVVFLGVQLGASVAGFAWLNFALILVWLWVATRIVREHRKRTL